MSLVAACVPHYIIGIALAAGIFGFHMLCEGFFKVKSEIPGARQCINQMSRRAPHAIDATPARWRALTG